MFTRLLSKNEKEDGTNVIQSTCNKESGQHYFFKLLAVLRWYTWIKYLVAKAHLYPTTFQILLITLKVAKK